MAGLHARRGGQQGHPQRPDRSRSRPADRPHATRRPTPRGGLRQPSLASGFWAASFVRLLIGMAERIGAW